MVALAVKENTDQPLVGITLMLLAYLVFSCIDTSAKWLSILGLAALQLAFMRYVGHFVISTLLIMRGGVEWQRFRSEKMGLVILRGALLMASTILNFIALRYIPLTLTATILFSAPIILCALSWPLLRERVGAWRWCAIMVGFIGIVVAMRPFDDGFHWAVLLSFAGAFSFAMYLVLTRKLSGVVPVDTMQFYSGAVGTLVLLPFAVAEWQSPVGAFDWAIMLGLGVFGWLGHQILTNAHSYAPASTLTPFAYTFILYLTVWSYFLFDHLPDVWTITGGAIIVAAGLFIWLRERHISRKRAPVPAG